MKVQEEFEDGMGKFVRKCLCFPAEERDVAMFFVSSMCSTLHSLNVPVQVTSNFLNSSSF